MVSEAKKNGQKPGCSRDIMHAQVVGTSTLKMGFMFCCLIREENCYKKGKSTHNIENLKEYSGIFYSVRVNKNLYDQTKQPSCITSSSSSSSLFVLFIEKKKKETKLELVLLMSQLDLHLAWVRCTIKG